MVFLGISGVAGAGKDLFFKKLKKELSKIDIAAKRFAIADALKLEINSITIPSFGIDALSCTREEKETIRDLLVAYGTAKRKQTEGRYWIEKLHDKIRAFSATDRPTVACITDVRYAEYERDEIHWVREELEGKLTHISQYSKPPHGWPEEKYWLKPANTEEERQDPLLKSYADYQLEWEFKKGSKEEVGEYTSSKAKKFLTWIQENEKGWLEKA